MKRAALFFSISIAATSGIVACGGGSSDAAPAPGSSAPAPSPGSPAPAPAPAPTPAPPPAGPASTEVPTLTRTTVVSGLASPWDLAFTPDGTMLYTEKCRGLSARFANGTTVRLFGTSRISAGGAGSLLRRAKRRSRRRRRSGLRDRHALRVRLHGVEPVDKPAHQSRRATAAQR